MQRLSKTPTKWYPGLNINKYLVQPLQETDTLQEKISDFVRNKLTKVFPNLPEHAQTKSKNIIKRILFEQIKPLIELMKQYKPQQQRTQTMFSSKLAANFQSLLNLLKINTRIRKWSSLKIGRIVDQAMVNEVYSWIDTANRIASLIAQARQYVPPERYDNMKNLATLLVYSLKDLYETLNV